MDQIKRYIMLVAAFLILGCESNKDSDGLNGSPEEVTEITEITENIDDINSIPSDGYDHHIDIIDSGESVYMYYSLQNLNPSGSELFFRVDSGECLRVKAEQFSHISIYASKGTYKAGPLSASANSFSAEEYTPLCTALLKCDPHNYVISSRDSGLFNFNEEQFVIHSADDFTSGQIACDYWYKIDKWMEFKVRQYVTAVGQENITDDTIKAQIEEWGLAP